MKMQHTSLYTLTKEWFGDSIQKIKQGSLKKKYIYIYIFFFSVIVVSTNLTSFMINKFLS